MGHSSKKAKRIAISLAVIIVLLFISGILGKSMFYQQNTEKNSVNLIELNIVGFGKLPHNFEQILNEMNAITEKKLGVTLNWIQMAEQSYHELYPILINSQKPVDLIWIAEWNNFKEYAVSGFFYDILPFMEKYCPTIYALAGNEQIQSSLVNGRLYHFPKINNSITASGTGFTYREDLRKKYNLPEIIDIDSIELYLKTMVSNESKLLPTYETSEKASMFSIYLRFNNKTNIHIGQMIYGFDISLDKNFDRIQKTWESQEFRDFAFLMRHWYESGFWTKDIILSSANAIEDLRTGIAASSFSIMHHNMFVDQVMFPAQVLSPEHEWKYVSFGEQTGYIPSGSPFNEGCAIPISSQYPELSARLMELFFTDLDLYRLYSFGIEGVNYKLDTQGYLQSMKAGEESTGLNIFSVKRSVFDYPDKKEDIKSEMLDRYESSNIRNYWSGFIEDDSAYAKEKAALENVYQKYAIPLITGMADDVNAAVDLLIQKAREAGYDKMYEELQEQWSLYYASIGIDSGITQAD